MKVLPWTHKAHEVLTLDQLNKIKASGGTTPTVLNENAHFRSALRTASLWCLLTDGEIDDHEVQDFAFGIGNAGLHGTAAIVILAGYLEDRPVECNISVGKSVYAVASNCVFLFHDVRSGTAYILQSKGCFHTLLPPGRELIVLDEHTTWDDLPKLDYAALAAVRVHAPRALAYDTVALASGKLLDLKQIYDDTLPEDMVGEVLGNNDNLTMLLLIATTRGRRNNVKEWIPRRKMKRLDPIWAKRPDPQNRILKITTQVVSSLQNGAPSEEVHRLHAGLRRAHMQSWKLLVAALDLDGEQVHSRNTVITDATARLDISHERRSSPMILSPVYPEPGPPSAQTTPMSVPSTIYSSTQHRRTRHGELPSHWAPGYAPEESYCPTFCDQLLYTNGCRINREADEHFYIGCEICGKTAVAALLLRKVTVEEDTAGFPKPGSHSKHVFPMVLGAYPETDILVPEIYCETCSGFLLLNGATRHGEKVSKALPLVSLSGEFGDINRKQWIKTIADAFDSRFYGGIVLQVFLSALYTTIDELLQDEAAEVQEAVRAMTWACKNLVRSIRVPMELIGSRKKDQDSSNGLDDVLANQLETLKEPGCSLLAYPVEGFVALMRAADEFSSSVCPRERVQEAIWLRFLLSLTEQLKMLDPAHEAGLQRLSDLLLTEPAARRQAPTSSPNTVSQGSGDGEPSLHVPQTASLADNDTTGTANGVTTVRLSQLEEIQLVSSDTMECFRHLRGMFPENQSWFHRALAVFLHALNVTAPNYNSSHTLFDDLKARRELRRVFFRPADLDELQAVNMVAMIYRKEFDTKAAV